jgi:protease-4
MPDPFNPAPPRPRRSLFGWFANLLVSTIVILSLGLNALFLWGLTLGDSNKLTEKHHSGKTLSGNKIAVVNIDGVLMEGLTGYYHKEIAQADGDSSVKAVVVRINSPGGTITASDDLHKRLTELRKGNPDKNAAAKPLIVSMGSIAASGGYYIAMPAQTIMAERTGITGSIGVYAALPDVTELSKKVGFSMRVMKAGDVKYSGSPFREMTPHEKQLWQEMVDHSYLQFLQVVEEGRPNLKGKLQEDIAINKTIPIREDKVRGKHVEYVRYIADGGIFTADEAKKYGLIDDIGYLDDAVKLAKQAANLGEDFKVVQYERPSSLFGGLFDIKARTPEPSVLAPERLSAAAVPRLWYLSPQADLAGLLKAMGQPEGD